MPRLSMVSGTIVDEYGEPVEESRYGHFSFDGVKAARLRIRQPQPD